MGCPELVQWCESEENKIKLVHIREKILDGYCSYNDILDLPVQQFSLGSWMGSTTSGTRRIKRRRKPAAEVIRPKGGAERPCREATPQTQSVAGPSTAVTGIFGFSPVADLTSRLSSTTPFVIGLQCLPCHPPLLVPCIPSPPPLIGPCLWHRRQGQWMKTK